MMKMDTQPLRDQLLANLEFVKQRISSACERSGRDPRDVTLITVSKYRPAEQIQIQYELGERHFGESRVQDGQAKIPDFTKKWADGPAEWHLIGQLQRNKAKYLPGIFQWVHSVDRLKTAEALCRAFSGHPNPVNILIQVNIAGEEQKGGCAPEDTLQIIEGCHNLGNVRVQGLMTMAPYCDDPEEARPVFKELAELAKTLRQQTDLSLPHLSMGMSGDFEVAIEEGATLVRVGSRLYEGMPDNS